MFIFAVIYRTVTSDLCCNVYHCVTLIGTRIYAHEVAYMLLMMYLHSVVAYTLSVHSHRGAFYLYFANS